MYDDIKVLKKLDKEIIDNPSIYKNLKIVYRPHPSRPNIFLHSKKINSLKNIILDPQMNNFIKSKNKKFLNNSNFYFEKLLSNSLFNVGGLTTVTIESLIFKKKQIFLCYNEDDSITDPKTLFEVNLHFEKIDQISALKKSESVDSVIRDFRLMFVNKSYENINKKLDEEINYFYNISKLKYSKKILSIIKSLTF